MKFNLFQFLFDTYQNKDGNFRRIMKVPPLNWCEFNNGKGKLFSFQKLMVQGIKKFAPPLFHKYFNQFFINLINHLFNLDVHLLGCTLSAISLSPMKF